MKKNNIKKSFILIKWVLLTGLLAIKYSISLNSMQVCIAKQTHINLNPDEHNQGLCHYPFLVSLGKFHEKTWCKFKWKEWWIEINQLKTLIKNTWCSCRYKFDGNKCNSNQKWNN